MKEGDHEANHRATVERGEDDLEMTVERAEDNQEMTVERGEDDLEMTEANRASGERGKEDLEMREENDVLEEPSVINCLRQRDRRQKILIAIIFNLALQIIILQINAAIQAPLVTITNFINFIQSMRVISEFLISHLLLSQGRFIRLQGRSVWRLEQTSPFVGQKFLGSHSQKEFKQRLRVNPKTYFCICSLVSPVTLKKKQGGGIPLETRVALSPNRLGTGNSLLGCADLFGMSEALASIVVRDFCDANINIIHPLVVPKWTKDELGNLAAQFEAKHDIPFVIGAIDGSHIPIIVPKGDRVPFYNRKGFYSVLLQGIVDCNTTFWDWDFSWAGSLDDYTMFVNSMEGRKVMAGYYEPYKLIGDPILSERACMSLSKGQKRIVNLQRHTGTSSRAQQECVLSEHFDC